MKILFACSEAVPFVKTGGLADVAGSLPNALVQRGLEVHVILPLYEKIGPRWREQMTFKRHFNVPLAWRNAYCGVFELVRDGVTYWFVDNEYYFRRSDLYGHFDDGERFAFFSRAVIDTCVQLGWTPDVIHCNDWQTALIPIYLLEAGRIAPSLANTKTMFTIHNIEYQGRYGRDILENTLGLDPGYFHERLLAYHGDVNLMKGAIYASDSVTTVSPTYAEQLCFPFFAHGLDGVIGDNHHKLAGILNGIDTVRNDPSNGIGIAAPYTANDLSGKAVCKAALQEMAGLDVNPNVPIIACVSRLVHHKGFDLVTRVLSEIMDQDVQMVVLGTGERALEDAFRRAQERYPGRFAAKICYSAELSDAIYAGADLFLMPSISEPCGLSQIIAMRYGTLPVVRETGGLKDTVTPYNMIDHSGTGFSFTNINAHDMLWVLRNAIDLYYNDQVTWQGLMRNAMTAKFDWERSAGAYTEIYKQITGGTI